MTELELQTCHSGAVWCLSLFENYELFSCFQLPSKCVQRLLLCRADGRLFHNEDL